MQQQLEYLKSGFKSLNLLFFMENFSNYAEKFEKEKINYISFLQALTEGELTRRHQVRINNLITRSKIPRTKTLANFDFERTPGISPSEVQKLSEGEWIDKNENILIFGAPGAGKTHLCLALTKEWCLRGRTAIYFMAAGLIQELLRARQENKMDLYIKKLDKFEVIIIDDISYIPGEKKDTDVLFHLFAARYEQRSLVITSNLSFSKWDQIFKDDMTTAAVIDRLVHHASILELKVDESFRKAEARKRQKIKIEEEAKMKKLA